MNSSQTKETQPKTDSRTSRRLGRMPQRDTSIEQIVRKHLFSMRMRFRTNNRDLPGSPDIANRRRRWVVFIHGCYWHHHKGCRRATIPTRNRSFWIEKFRANRRRDQQSLMQLCNLGYDCTVIWECEIKERPVVAKKKLLRLVQKIQQKEKGLGMIHGTPS